MTICNSGRHGRSRALTVFLFMLYTPIAVLVSSAHSCRKWYAAMELVLVGRRLHSRRRQLQSDYYLAALLVISGHTAIHHRTIAVIPREVDIAKIR